LVKYGIHFFCRLLSGPLVTGGVAFIFHGMDHEGGMEEELVGQIFEAMMISASGEGFVPFSATRGGRVAKSVKIWAFAGCYRYGLTQSSR
jgi:hypothetical protein